MTELIQETIRELGFKNLDEFLSLKLIQELEKKIHKYETDIKEYEKKYGMPFPEFKEKYLTSKSEEDFAKSDDGAEWEWDLFAIESSRTKILKIKKC